MALSAVKTSIERALDKDLSDLVRGIRAHKDNETKYIQECIEEIKHELKAGNISSKANAINKLTYLQMLGYDISWAAFNIIEVMSSPRFSFKRIGYLAASQSFGERTDVLMLATNLIRKDLNCGKLYDMSVALSGLSCFVTTDLARDLCDDILALTMAPKPYIAKKAILLMYRVFLKNPDALYAAFPRLRKKLEDPDPGVQSAAVNVICELARKNPQNYLSLSPIFFRLMTTSANNWVLIKIIKLFGALTPLEPRLGKKLIEPLTTLIHNTSAMSLLYECINTVLAGVPDHSASIQLCVQKLRILIEDSDQNLKYLGLLAMSKILRHHPKSVQAHKDLILACLDDRDESIRLRALDLLHGMVSRSSLVEVVGSLVKRLQAPEITAFFRSEIISTVVRVCSQGNYQCVVSFEWYISVLIELAQLNINRSGELLANQLLDVAVRVASVRPFAVSQMAIFLRSCKSMMTHSNQQSLHDVIYAAAWICGEYASFLEKPQDTLEALLETASLVDLRGHIQSVLVLNALKLYCKLAAKWFSETTQGALTADNALPETKAARSLPTNDLQAFMQRLLELTDFLMDKISQFVHSADLEVQDRAVSIHKLLHLVVKRLSKLLVQSGAAPGSASERTSAKGESVQVIDLLTGAPEEQLDLRANSEEAKPSGEEPPKEQPEASEGSAEDRELLVSLHALLHELCRLFEGELNPVAPKAQRKVPLPEGLDLDAWINEPPPPPPPPPSNGAPEGVFSTTTAKKKVKKDKQVSLETSNVVAKTSGGGIFTGLVEPEGPRPVKLSRAEIEEMKRQRLQLQESNPHYLKPTKGNSNNLTATHEEPKTPPGGSGNASESTPVTVNGGLQLASSDKFAMEVQKRLREMKESKLKAASGKGEKKRKGKKGKKSETAATTAEAAAEDEDEELGVDGGLGNVTVSTVFDLPEGVAPNELDSGDDDTDVDPSDPHRLLNIQLDIPPLDLPKASAESAKTTKAKKGGKTAKKSRSKQRSPERPQTETSKTKPSISEEAFLKVLADPALTASSKAKVRCPATAEAVQQGTSSEALEEIFLELLQRIQVDAEACVVERIGTTASVYAESQNRPVCLLLKLSTQTGSVSIEAKSTGQASAEDLVQRLRPCVKSFHQ